MNAHTKSLFSVTFVARRVLGSITSNATWRLTGMWALLVPWMAAPRSSRRLQTYLDTCKTWFTTAWLKSVASKWWQNTSGCCNKTLERNWRACRWCMRGRLLLKLNIHLGWHCLMAFWRRIFTIWHSASCGDLFWSVRRVHTTPHFLVSYFMIPSHLNALGANLDYWTVIQHNVLFWRQRKETLEDQLLNLTRFRDSGIPFIRYGTLAAFFGQTTIDQWNQSYPHVISTSFLEVRSPLAALHLTVCLLHDLDCNLAHTLWPSWSENSFS